MNEEQIKLCRVYGLMDSAIEAYAQVSAENKEDEEKKERSEQESTTERSIQLNGPILPEDARFLFGDDMVSASSFKKEMEGLDADATITVVHNSPGGETNQMKQIMVALGKFREGGGTVVTDIESLSASAASAIALMGTETRMSEVAKYMMHNPHMVAAGDASYLMKQAGELKKTTDEMAALYAKNSSWSVDKVLQKMEDETFLSATEAKEAGFVDKVYDLVPKKAEPAPASAEAYVSPLDIFAIERKSPAFSILNTIRGINNEGDIHE